LTVDVLFIAASCRIETQGYGLIWPGPPTAEGFVKLNGQQVFHSDTSSWASWVPARGVNTFLIDPNACSVIEENHYDTFADSGAAPLLKAYLDNLPDNSLLVVVSCDEPSARLSDALSTLAGLGADVADVQFRGAFTFVAKKGTPSMTLLDKVLTQQDSQTMQPVIDAIVQGRTLASNAGLLIYCLVN